MKNNVKKETRNTKGTRNTKIIIRSRAKINRIMALLLAVIMLSSAFFPYIGGKAADGGSGLGGSGDTSGTIIYTEDATGNQTNISIPLTETLYVSGKCYADIMKTSETNLITKVTIKNDEGEIYSKENEESELVESKIEISGTNIEITFEYADKASPTDADKFSEETIQIGDIVIDDTKPVAEVIRIERKEKTSETWELFYEGDDKKDILINSALNENYEYRYVLNIEDENLSEIIDTSINGADTRITRDDTDESTYYYSLQLSELFDSTSANADKEKYQVSVNDLATNETVLVMQPSIKIVDMKTYFNVVVQNKNGDTVVLDNTAINYTTEKLYLKITASSGYEFINMKVENDGHSDSNIILDSALGQAFTAQRFKFALKKNDEKDTRIVIPKGVDVTAYLKNIKITLTNSNPVIEDAVKVINIEDIFYDKSRPEVQIKTANANWVKSIEAEVVYSDNKETVESGIDRYGFSFSGSSNDELDVATVIYDVTSKVVTRHHDIPESKDVTGTTLSAFVFDKAGNVSETKEQVYFVDKTIPSITNFVVNEKDIQEAPLVNNPIIKVDAYDILTLERLEIVVTKPNSEKAPIYTHVFNMEAEQSGEGVSSNFAKSLEDILGAKPLDGTYTVTACVYDKAGNVSAKHNRAFVIDNTVPVIEMKVISGTAGGKAPRLDEDNDPYDLYYSSDVAVKFSCIDDNFMPENTKVTYNGELLDVEWNNENGVNVAKATFAAEGEHSIKLETVDKAGNASVVRTLSFSIDKTRPAIATLLNGAIYYMSDMGILNYNSNLLISAIVTDLLQDGKDFHMQVVKTVPYNEPQISEVHGEEAKTVSFTDEAEYNVTFKSIDLASNVSDIKTVAFRIDKTRPELNISASTSGISTSGVTTTFSMTEAFWKDAKATVRIYRKANDSTEEVLFKTLDFVPKEATTTMTENITETGEYRFEFEAVDATGNTANTTSTFIVDRNAPVITLSGIKNYDMTKNDVIFGILVDEDFYTTKTVSITGSRLDAAGKVNNIAFPSVNQSDVRTTLNQTFSENGIYDIEVTSKDAAGNVSVITVRFTIDKTAPIIEELAEFDGTILNDFIWDRDIDELATDLSVCTVSMYLNGSEYDGTGELLDGSYIMLIVAEDELGNKSEKTYKFVLDTKAPVIIVTGVEDGEVKNELYDIDVSLQLEEDTLTSVKLNGKEKAIYGNMSSIEVSTKGEYVLDIEAVDEAGNIANASLSFTYGTETARTAEKIEDTTESLWWLWIIAIGGSLVLLAIIVLIFKLYQKGNK